MTFAISIATSRYEKQLEAEMKSTRIKGIVGAAILGLTVMLGISAASGTAEAQYGYGQGRRGDRYERDLFRIAREKGRQDGLYEGENRARARKSYDPYGSRSYKKAVDGYDSRMGNKSEYQRVYREAYLRGYEDGYRRYSR